MDEVFIELLREYFPLGLFVAGVIWLVKNIKKGVESVKKAMEQALIDALNGMLLSMSEYKGDVSDLLKTLIETNNRSIKNEARSKKNEEKIKEHDKSIKYLESKLQELTED